MARKQDTDGPLAATSQWKKGLTVQFKPAKVPIEDASNFEKVIREAIDGGVSDSELDEVDDRLIAYLDSGEPDIHAIIACCERLLNIYAEYNKDELRAFTFSTLVAAHIRNDDIASTISVMEMGVKFSLDVKAPNPGYSIVKNALPYLMCSDVAVDTRLTTLAVCTKFLAEYMLHEELIKAYINAAYIFAENGAYPAAYRVLEDAEAAAENIQGGTATIEVLSVRVGIVLQEGAPEPCLKIGHEVIKTIEEKGLTAPIDLLANVATAYQRYEAPEKAIELYEQIFDKVKASQPSNMTKLAANLSICRRKMGDIEGALREESVAREYSEFAAEDKESLLELELVTAVNHVANDDHEIVMSSLASSAQLLDQIMSKSLRLNYRRGWRQRFVNRIEPIICALPTSGVVQDLLGPLAVCRSNAVSDWMHFLDWAKEVSSNPAVPGEKKAELENYVSRLKDLGTPFIYEYYEKYDDPFQRMAIPSPWGCLSTLVEDLVTSYGLARPYDDALIDKKIILFKERLAEGNVLVLWLRSSLLFIRGESYYRYELGRADEKSFFEKLISYRFNSVTMREMAEAIAEISNRLTDALESVDNVLKFPGNCQFIYMPDAFDRLSLVPSFVKRGSTDWGLRVAPILYKRSCTEVLIERIVGIPDNPGELLLAEAELNHISKIFDQAVCTFVDKTDEESFLKAMKTADALVITTHGFPLANFKDPYFASLGGPDTRHVINTATIQREFINLPYSLVLINSCHGTSSLPKGPSYDMVSFPILMLMNKKSSVIASSWKTLDKISYLFSHALFEMIKKNPGIDSAYMEALLKLATMDGDQAFDILTGIEDEKIREIIITGSSKENLNQMLHHPYCYGTFQLYTLF